jgi:hypothetical protein
MDTTQHPTARCVRCGRVLRSAKAVAAGCGRTCKAKIAAAAKTATAKPAQVEKARELVELGAIVPIRGRRVFRSISSDGTRSYLTAAGNCNCPAGLKSKECYHSLAVRLIAAA